MDHYPTVMSQVVEETVRRLRRETIELAVESVGVGPTLLVGHGLSGNRHVSLERFSTLEDMYRIVAFDQRGHGDSSPVTDASLYDPQAMADDILAMLDFLKVKRAVIAGESMGAATALLFALEHPERVDKLLLTGPAFGDELNLQRDWLKSVGADILERGLDAYLETFESRLRHELGAPENVITSLVSVYKSHQPESLAVAFQATADWCPIPNLSALNELDVPVSIVAWDGDDLHPLALAERMVQNLPNATLVQLASLVELLAKPASAARAHRQFLLEH